MLLFVTFDGGQPIHVEAEPGDTVRSALETAYRTHEPGRDLPENGKFTVHAVTVNKGIGNPAVTLADVNAQQHWKLSVKFLAGEEAVVDQAVLPKLQAFLRIAAGELGPGEITFIGIASFDHSHGDASIKRQQCPDALLTHCIENRVDLNIVLIDEGFSDVRSAHRQVYDFAGWHLVATENGGKVRQYSYGPAAAASACDIWLTVFCTGIGEYKSDFLAGAKTVGGIHIPSTFAVIGTLGNPESCVICGNFYPTPTPKNQYFTIGPARIVTAAGFEPN